MGELEEKRRRVKEVIRMRNDTVLENNEARTWGADRVLRVTALQYLKEALAQEHYEDCAELVRAAKEFGAQPNHIRGILTGHGRRVTGAPQTLAVIKKGWGRRF